MQRRSFIFGLGASLAVIRTPGLLMPIKPVVERIAPGPWLIQWGPSTIYAEGMPPHVMDAIRADIEAVNSRLQRTLYDDLQWREVEGEDWTYQVTKAPPGGFKIARA